MASEVILDDHHPVVVSGRPAEVIIDIMRKVKEKPLIEAGVCLIEIASVSVDQPAILVNQARPYVIAQGKLVNHNGRSLVDIKHISFLGLPWGGLEMLDKQKYDMSAHDQSFIQESHANKRRQMKQVMA